MPLNLLDLPLPPLLLRLLLLVLRFPPFVPGPSAQPPQGPPKASGRALSNRHDPARRPWPASADAPLAPAHPAIALPAPQHVPGSRSSALDAPQSWETCTPPRPKSFLEKTLIAREASAQHPANTPSVPAPSPGPSAGHMPHAQGTCQPIPVAPMGRLALSLAPPSARSFPASEARNLAQKKSAQTVSRQPVPSGDGLARDGSPLHPHASAAHARPARPCTLLPRSTVTPRKSVLTCQPSRSPAAPPSAPSPSPPGRFSPSRTSPPWPTGCGLETAPTTIPSSSSSRPSPRPTAPASGSASTAAPARWRLGCRPSAWSAAPR